MSDAQPRLIRDLNLAQAAVRRRVAAGGDGLGLTAAAAGLLFVLAEQGPSRMGDISRALSASPAGVSGLVDRLVERGLVARGPDPADRRVQVAELTDAGRALLAPAARAAGQITAELVDGFTEEEVEVVARWLRQAASVG